MHSCTHGCRAAATELKQVLEIEQHAPPQSRTHRVYVCCGNADRLNVAHPASVYVVTTHALELVEATLTTARAVHILKDVLFAVLAETWKSCGWCKLANFGRRKLAN